MRRLVIITISLVYLAVSSGIIVNSHYCMGKLAEVVFGHDESSDRCPKCGMEDAPDCCHDDVKVVKLADSHSLAKEQVSIAKMQAVLPDFTNTISVHFSGASAVSPNYIHGPPDQSPVPLHILHCVYRI